MQLISLLLSALFFGINCTNCPIGYADGGDGSCYSSIIARTSRNIAYNKCSVDGGYLYDINSGVENTRIAQRAGTAETIWLGLTCLSNEKTSCLWDATGRPIVLGSFINFIGGAPNMTRGPCVYMDVRTGGWLSGDCTSNTVYYGCKFTPNITVPTCSTLDNTTIDGASSTVFREKCYWGIDKVNSSDGQLFCANGCGTIASIHSLGENAFIDTFAWSFSSLAFAYTGLASNANGNYSWADGSPFDYNNFGYQNAQLGNCVAMSLYGKTIPQGKWINSGCSQTLAVVCERVWHQPSCLANNTRDPYISTKAPSKCSSTQYLTGNGTINFNSSDYSDGSPIAYSCEYVITEPYYEQAQIQITTNLSPGSSLTFYSSETYPSLVYTLTDVNENLLINSTTNVLRMYFNTTGGYSTWTGYYQYIPICKATFVGYGKITNYPNDCIGFVSACIYRFNSRSDVTCFIFDEININNEDYLRIYDGEVGDDLIEEFAPSDSSSQVICSSKSSILSVDFRIDPYNDTSTLRGFRGRYASNSDSLQTQIHSGNKALSLSFFLVIFFFVYNFFE